MADTLSERLKANAGRCEYSSDSLLTVGNDYSDVLLDAAVVMLEAAAELDRREAIAAAAEAWAKAAHANKRPGILMDEEIARNALFALLPQEIEK